MVINVNHILIDYYFFHYRMNIIKKDIYISGGFIMPQSTITRAELTEALHQRVGLPRQQANEVLESTLTNMIQGLVGEGFLKLSSFGSFSVRSKNDRVGRNPKTGQEVTITPRKAISFKASHILKDRVVNSKTH